jgi:hypothetical protein
MFDHELATALRLDRRTLLVDWQFVDPAKVPEFASRKDAPVPWEGDFPGDDENREKLIELIEGLRGENLVYLRSEAEKLWSVGFKEARRIDAEARAKGTPPDVTTKLIKQASAKLQKQ